VTWGDNWKSKRTARQYVAEIFVCTDVHATTFKEGYVCTSNTHQRGADGGVRLAAKSSARQAQLGSGSSRGAAAARVAAFEHMLRLVPPTHTHTDDGL
jgi:hypothetical protein